LSARPLRELVSFLLRRPRPAALDEPLPTAIEYEAHGNAPRRLAESEPFRAMRAGTICVQALTSTRGETVITEERVQDQLRNVIDPEIGMDLVELGLIYDVGVHDEGRHVDVTFSLTSPMCPVGDLIQEQVETEALSIEGVETVTAQLTFDPMWNPDMMSPAAKLFFGR
jgi:metal-sulfur cluster biosynthetic enzyme